MFTLKGSMTIAGIGVIYRWSVDPAVERQFVARWAVTTRRLRQSYGALGSCLLKDRNGDFIAFARWPSAEARRRAFQRFGPAEPWPGVLRFSESELTVVQDLLLTDEVGVAALPSAPQTD